VLYIVCKPFFIYKFGLYKQSIARILGAIAKILREIAKLLSAIKRLLYETGRILNEIRRFFSIYMENTHGNN
jgi:hypothetical protein